MYLSLEVCDGAYYYGIDAIQTNLDSNQSTSTLYIYIPLHTITLEIICQLEFLLAALKFSTQKYTREKKFE